MPNKPRTHRPRGAPTLTEQRRDYERTKRKDDPALARAKKIRSSVRWQRCRALQLRRDPLCARCLSLGRTTAAAEVHHVKGLRTHPLLAFTPANMVSLCVPCHRTVEKESA